MPSQDAQEIRQKILSIIRFKGPSLPVQIARVIQMSPLFAGAFLSELVSEKEIKMSTMKVGGSPLYLIPGQEPQLEKFFEFIKGKEKEALLLLKNKKFLKDSNQEPAIRVALRSIRDFAIPFRHQETEQIYWRYFTVPMSEFSALKKPEPIQVPKPIPKPEKKVEIKVEEKLVAPKITTPIRVAGGADGGMQYKPRAEKQKTLGKETLDIFDKKQKLKKTKSKKKSPLAQNNKFFDKVKQYLQKNSIELSDIESFSKNTIILKVKIHNQEQLLVAYNKKRIDEKDIILANKKAEEMKLNYTILGLGKPAKKINKLMDAMKNLSKIREIE